MVELMTKLQRSPVRYLIIFSSMYMFIDLDSFLLQMVSSLSCSGNVQCNGVYVICVVSSGLKTI